jgi:hypothetical protein
MKERERAWGERPRRLHIRHAFTHHGILVQAQCRYVDVRTAAGIVVLLQRWN